MFLSLKRYLDNDSDRVASALLRMVQLLLQGIGLHAVKGDLADYDEFQLELQKVQVSLGERPSASEVLVLAGAIAKALEEYNSRTTRFMHLQTAELQAMIAMLTKAVTALTTGSEMSLGRLQDIEKHLHKATMIEDFQTAKIRLSECLDTLRGEMVRQRDESARNTAELKEVLQKSQDSSTAGLKEVLQKPQERPTEIDRPEARQDPVTGLLDRSSAEAELSAAVSQSRSIFVAVFVVNRLDLINSRFGREVGDQVMVFFARHLAQNFSRSDKLFRWTGPGLLALLERSDGAGQVGDEVSRIASHRLSQTVQVGSRAVMLPLTAKWTVLPALEIRPVRLLIHQIDSFVHNATVAEQQVSA